MDKKNCPKENCTKKKWAQKNWAPPKKGQKKMWPKKNWSEKNKGQKKIGLKKKWAEKKLGRKKKFDQATIHTSSSFVKKLHKNCLDERMMNIYVVWIYSFQPALIE